MAAATYDFRPMTVGDLGMVRQWLQWPHVVEWWGEPDEQFQLVSGDLDHPDMDQFIVATGGRPFGYIQRYDPEDWPPHPFGAQPQGTLGIDQFIGEPDMIDRGHGSAFIRAFVEHALAEGTPRVLTDPDPVNTRAVRAYEKAGFRPERLVDTPDGVALLMVRNG
jgi:aminoglycoside 6'-N-acetyltransferase